MRHSLLLFPRLLSSALPLLSIVKRKLGSQVATAASFAQPQATALLVLPASRDRFSVPLCSQCGRRLFAAFECAWSSRTTSVFVSCLFVSPRYFITSLLRLLLLLFWERSCARVESSASALSRFSYAPLLGAAAISGRLRECQRQTRLFCCPRTFSSVKNVSYTGNIKETTFSTNFKELIKRKKGVEKRSRDNQGKLCSSPFESTGLETRFLAELLLFLQCRLDEPLVMANPTSASLTALFARASFVRVRCFFFGIT